MLIHFLTQVGVTPELTEDPKCPKDPHCLDIIDHVSAALLDTFHTRRYFAHSLLTILSCMPEN